MEHWELKVASDDFLLCLKNKALAGQMSEAPTWPQWDGHGDPAEASGFGWESEMCHRSLEVPRTPQSRRDGTQDARSATGAFPPTP